MDIFCKIINKEIPSQLIYEDDLVIAFKDINPKRKGHFLVVPKNHSESLININEDDLKHAMSMANILAKRTIKELGVSGYNLEVNTGKEAGQEVFHTHIHIIPTNK